jgi:hypothetical protein
MKSLFSFREAVLQMRWDVSGNVCVKKEESEFFQTLIFVICPCPERTETFSGELRLL